MFDLAWSELAVIGIVAVVVIGPKNLPEAIRGLAEGIRKLRRMAGEFQGQMDEVVREANLHEVRDSLNEIRNFNIRDQIEKAVDADGTIRKTFTEDPLKTDYSSSYTPPPVTPVGDGTTDTPAAPATPAEPPPAFVPPGTAAPRVAEASPPPAPPAFIPPNMATPHNHQAPDSAQPPKSI